MTHADAIEIVKAINRVWIATCIVSGLSSASAFLTFLIWCKRP